VVRSSWPLLLLSFSSTFSRSRPETLLLDDLEPDGGGVLRPVAWSLVGVLQPSWWCCSRLGLVHFSRISPKPVFISAQERMDPAVSLKPSHQHSDPGHQHSGKQTTRSVTQE
jgi:hypothetical protein